MAHADPAPSEEDLGEQGYYLDSLRGVHQSLSFMGKPPLFILKDEWEASPPAKEKSYHQILDPRTRAFMKVAKQEEIEIQPVALVQWKVPHAGPGLNALNPKSGEKGPEPEYTIKVAMMNADVMGVGADDEEELDVVSSDDEDGILLRKGKNQVENDSLTVYYPLIPMPCRHRGKELRKVLSLADENSGAIGRVAMEWLDEIKRVDKFPNIHNEG